MKALKLLEKKKARRKSLKLRAKQKVLRFGTKAQSRKEQVDETDIEINNFCSVDENTKDKLQI